MSVKKYLDYEGLKVYHQKLETLRNNDNRVITSAFNELNTKETNNSESIENIKADINNLKSLKITTTIEILYEDLVDLRDNNNLVPGLKYRIIDYVTTSGKEDTISAEHEFDIIVTANSNNTLNENAFAAINSEDNLYFVDCNLESWLLKYCLDNDTNRFEWADSQNGKGVIYYMKDEWNNECPYDFKNIMFKRVKVVNQTGYQNNIDNTYSGIDAFLDNDEYDTILKSSDTTPKYFYTFHVTDTENNLEQDATVSIYHKENTEDEENLSDVCSKNIIYPLYKRLIENEEYNWNTMSLPNIVFRNEHYYIDDSNCAFVRCSDNIVNGYGMTFGNYCNNNIFIGSNYGNILGFYCFDNIFENCNSNILGNNCRNNTFNRCSYSTLYSNNLNNSFRNNCTNIILYQNCHDNVFEENCTNISFVKPFTHNVTVENGNSFITLTSTQTPNNTNSIGNITISQGVNNSTTVKTISHNTLNDLFKTTYLSSNSRIVYL